MTTENWKEIAAEKQRATLQSIPAKWLRPTIKDDMETSGYTNTRAYLDLILGTEEVEITNLTVVELQEAVKTRKLSSFEITSAYCHRAALTHQIVNCCTEIFIDEALERAKDLDKYLEQKGEVSGPLHGIPISLKDQVDLPGKASSIGYVSLANEAKTEISLLAKHLLELGAVFYVKTTVPMAMMAPETVSNLFGYTSNSLNVKLSAGGSSGGEGALIAAGASPLGFGTDIGGSIRIPSAFHGLYALKPSGGRISYLNVTNSASGQECMPSVIGPMARSLEDVQRVTKLLVDAQLWQWDPKVVPMPWMQPDPARKKFTFGMWRFDSLVMPHPPILRALEIAAASLAAQGHEIIEIELPDPQAVLDTANKIYGADFGVELAAECKKSGEPVVPIVRRCVSESFTQTPLTVNEWWDLCNETYLKRQNFANFWQETATRTKSGSAIDAIVCPVWPSTSCVPNSEPTLNYTAPFNVYDCASVVVPITKVDAQVDVPNENYAARNALDKKIHDSYEPALFDKMPVCVQVVTPKLHEEIALSLAAVVVQSVKK